MGRKVTWSTDSGSAPHEESTLPSSRWVKIFVLVATPLAALLGAFWGGLQLLEDRADRVASEVERTRKYDLEMSRIMAQERQSQRLHQKNLAREQTKRAEAENARAEAELQQATESAREARHEHEQELAELAQIERQLELEREKIEASERQRAEDRELYQESALVEAIGRVLSGDPDASDVLTLLRNLERPGYREEILDALAARLGGGSSLIEVKLIWRHLSNESIPVDNLVDINVQAMALLDAQVLATVSRRTGSTSGEGIMLDDVCRGIEAYRRLPREIPPMILICQYMEHLLGMDCATMEESIIPLQDLLREALATGSVEKNLGQLDREYQDGLYRKAAFLLGETNMLLRQECAALSGEELEMTCGHASVPGFISFRVPFEALQHPTYWERSNRLAHAAFGSIGRRGPVSQLEEICDRSRS